MDNLIWEDTWDGLGGKRADYFGCHIFVYPGYNFVRPHWTINSAAVGEEQLLLKFAGKRIFNVPYVGDMEEGKRIVLAVMNEAFSDYFRIS